MQTAQRRGSTGPTTTRTAVPPVPLKKSTSRPSSRAHSTSTGIPTTATRTTTTTTTITVPAPLPATRRPSAPNTPVRVTTVRQPSATRSTSRSPVRAPSRSSSITRTVVVAAPARRTSQPHTAPAAGAAAARPNSARRSLPSLTVHTPPQGTRAGAPRTHSTSRTTSTPTTTSTRSPAVPVSPASRRGSTPAAPSFRRTNSFQVVSTTGSAASVARDTTALPPEFYVMYCHRCFRFSCARRQAGQTAQTAIACPTCRHTPVEVPRTRSGLYAMYSRAAVKHNADPNSTVALQAMISLHHQTHAPVVLFRGMTNPPPSSSTTTTTTRPAASRRPFVEDTFTPEEIMFTFEQFPQGLGKYNGDAVDTTCVVCLEECGGCGRPVVKLQGCGHYFHAACVKPWILQKNYTCPMCRAPLIAREPA